MNSDNTVEYNSLSWVKAQLDDVLLDAQSSLNEYIENKSKEHLENCIEHLQLIFGTLQMVEVYGAAMLADEMQQTTAALLAGEVDREEDAFDVLMRAMLQLPDYLEKVQAGHKDAPITLMPLFNDLRAARKEGLLTESVLFSPDLVNVDLPADGYDASAIEPGKLQGEVKRLRTHYQLGLLDFIRNKKERAGLQRIKAVLSSLEKVSAEDEVRRLWVVIGALVEGLLQQGIESNLSIKILMGAVDRQLKQILDSGEEKFAKTYSKELVTNILYYVGTSSVDSKTVAAVKKAYHLDDLIPQHTDDSASIGGLNADLFDTVSVGITEDLNKVKDILELYMTSTERDLEQLVPVADQLGRIGDTYGMLGMGAVRQSIMEQRNVIESIIKSETELSEPVILNVASELLQAESELKDYIAERSGFVDPNRKSEDQRVPAAEYRQVMLTVVTEALNNFSQAKEAVLSYVSGIGDKEQLDIIMQRLEEVRGVAMMLPLGRVETLIMNLQNYIRVALNDNDRQPDAGEQDTVADVVTSIEYFFEALSEGRPGVEQGLSAGEAAAARLVMITESYSEVESSVNTVSEAIAADEINPAEITAAELTPEETTAAEIAAEEIAAEETAAEETAAVDMQEAASEEVQPEAVEALLDDSKDEDKSSVTEEATLAFTEEEHEYNILADDADEEIVEIFIEEAVEVLGELHTYLPQWQANHNDEEALAVIRRSFHTLKGSGRLLGAELIGEFSWKFENMLNRVIDSKINVSEQLFNALDEALNVLPQLIEQLKGNREPIDNIGQLMSVADAISEGRDVAVSHASAVAPSKAPVAEELEAVEEETIPVSGEIASDEPAAVDMAAVEDNVIDITDEALSDDDVISMETFSTEAGLEDNDSDIIDISGIDVESADAESVDTAEAVEDAIDLSAFAEDASEELDINLRADSDEDVINILDTEDADDETVIDETDDVTIDITDADVSEIEDVTDIADLSAEMEPGEAEIYEDFASEPTDPVGVSPEDDVLSASDNEFSTDDIEIITDEDESLSLESGIGSIGIVDSDLDDTALDVEDGFDIEIDEQDINVRGAVLAEGALDIDPMLLKIYSDESKSHIESIRQLLKQSDENNTPLQADKALMRNFHTLYGSARTAEVEAIAELSGPAEKYIKARQDGEREDIPSDVTDVIRELVDAISAMLEKVSEGNAPEHNKVLQEKINKVVQQEIQDQLQKSWQENAAAQKHRAEFSTEDIITASSADELSSEFNADEADVVSLAELGEEFEAFTEDELTAVQDAVSASSLQAEAEQGDDETAVVTSAAEAEAVPVSYGDIDDELIDIFLEEADELLENCEQTLAAIKNTPNSTEHIHQLQRNMHTLKGGARMAELTPIGNLTHNLESLVVMVSESKIEANKFLFDLLQESLDSLTTMLNAVKQRQAIISASELNDRVEMLMRGEVADQRAVERFDIELSDLEAEAAATDDMSELMPDDDSVSGAEVAAASAAEAVVESEESAAARKRRKEDKERDMPHWGERASDVNFRDSQEQVRVRSDLLNNLVNYAGEVNIYHARMGKQISDFSFNLSELTQTVVRLKEQLRKLEIETEIQIRSGYEKESDTFDDNFDPLEMDQYSTLQQLTRSLSETAGDVDSINGILTDITRDSETLLLQESRVSTDLQEGLMRTRMVRFGGLSSRLRRIVRQISRELGKEVEVEIVGESSEVDRTVLDRIIAPLEHMLRNAVAHGIESPEQRRAAGKSETGNITITVDRQGTNVVVKVRDDGAGIDVSRIRDKAIKQGIIKAEQKLSDHDVLQLILQSGFSTAEEVTQVSGRGVGMDVVDSEIKQLGGVLDINTVKGQGTEFHIRLPLTLAINQALLVSVAEDVYAVPLASIEGVVRITGLELQQFYDSDNSHYEFNGVNYELKHLGGMLTGNQADYSKQLRLFPVLLVHVGDQHFALHVDDLVGRREIVVKPVGMQIGTVRGIAGATILADGRVVLILEMSALVAAESLFKPYLHEEIVQEVKEEAVVDTKKTIMVVDDSITIRKVTERMLQRYGIEVILAKDGVDATNQLQDRVPDLMLLDIEMPRMDGFEVASFVRNDDRLKNVPIIMITSRTGSKHKDKAMAIGVDRYLGKPFQEDDLVGNINEILKTAF